MDGKLDYRTFETQLRGNMRFQDSSDQQMQLRPLVTEPHEDIVSKYHKLQQEAEHLRALLAEEEAHSRGLQRGITKLRKELQRTKRRMRSERYFKRKRNCREAEGRHPQDFQGLSATMRRHHGNYRHELHNFRQWDDRPEFMSVPGLHTQPFHNAPYHRGPSANGWSNGQINANQAWNNPRPMLRR